MLKPLLSIIVPCYNAQPYLARCLAPLLAVERGLEVILVDDGSTDQTGAMVDQYAAAHPTLIRALHQANGGHGAAIMAG
ncbi:MAG TPA: glycosyltransferase, partial [Limosilactobacillus ingluviei]|nr:glycosyltransferase [Limosilactobacillus ingluviei]